MDDRDEVMHEAATLYYLQDETMESIGRHLGMSRSAVSRLLKLARERGMVKVQVRPPGSGGAIASRVEALFHVRAHVVPVRTALTDDARLDNVARYAAHLIQGWFRHGMTLGLAWGTTVAAVSSHLTHTPLREATVVQLNGATNTSTSGLAHGSDLVTQFAQAFDAVPEHFPVPAFFDLAATRDLMWRERSIQHVLGVQARTDLAVFGVGALVAPVPSRVYISGYLEQADQVALAQDGVVGDVCTIFLREDGSWEDISINQRATGPTPRQLQAIDRRLCVVSGDAKVVPLRAALRAGVATDLVIDEPTAAALVRGRLP